MKHELVTQLPVWREVPGHFHAAPFWLTQEMFGGLPVEVVGGDLSGLVNAPVAARHAHDVPEVYLLLSPTAGGAEIEVEVGEARLTLCSPAALYIPAGVEHRFVTRRAEPGSNCFGVLIRGTR